MMMMGVIDSWMDGLGLDWDWGDGWMDGGMMDWARKPKVPVPTRKLRRESRTLTSASGVLVGCV